MIEIKGKYSFAVIYTDQLEDTAAAQIAELCNQEFVQGCKIRIMPDVHAGAGCVIGFTADLGDKVIPNIVGVDIGCGVLCAELGQVSLDLVLLDEVIRKHIPSGMDVHEGRQVRFPKLQEMHCFRELKDTRRIERSIGTLGGGNHFIEASVDDDGNHYLIIHSGSRNLGKQVAEYYQNLAIELCSGKEDYFSQRDELIRTHKESGRRHLIQDKLKLLKAKYEQQVPQYPKDLCFLSGKYRERYLFDMRICQEYADLNRKVMASVILKRVLDLEIENLPYFQTVHNYINFNDNIIRKGSISAYAGEKVLIPINMRDGSLICVGKGNQEWNYSAPHGAGRVMSRNQARLTVSLEEYEESMKGIFTTSVNEATIDESPFVYKPVEEILSHIGDTVDVVKRIRPIYNFKAGE